MDPQNNESSDSDEDRNVDDVINHYYSVLRESPHISKTNSSDEEGICDDNENPWELCDDIIQTTLDQIRDHSVYRSSGSSVSTVLKRPNQAFVPLAEDLKNDKIESVQDSDNNFDFFTKERVKYDRKNTLNKRKWRRPQQSFLAKVGLKDTKHDLSANDNLKSIFVVRTELKSLVKVVTSEQTLKSCYETEAVNLIGENASPLNVKQTEKLLPLSTFPFKNNELDLDYDDTTGNIVNLVTAKWLESDEDPRTDEGKSDCVVTKQNVRRTSESKSFCTSTPKRKITSYTLESTISQLIKKSAGRSKLKEENKEILTINETRKVDHVIKQEIKAEDTKTLECVKGMEETSGRKRKTPQTSQIISVSALETIIVNSEAEETIGDETKQMKEIIIEGSEVVSNSNKMSYDKDNNINYKICAHKFQKSNESIVDLDNSKYITNNTADETEVEPQQVIEDKTHLKSLKIYEMVVRDQNSKSFTNIPTCKQEPQLMVNLYNSKDLSKPLNGISDFSVPKTEITSKPNYKIDTSISNDNTEIHYLDEKQIKKNDNIIAAETTLKGNGNQCKNNIFKGKVSKKKKNRKKVTFRRRKSYKMPVLEPYSTICSNASSGEQEMHSNIDLDMPTLTMETDIEDEIEDDSDQVVEIVIKDSDVVNNCDISDGTLINSNDETLEQEGNELLDANKERDEVVNFKVQSDSKVKSNISEIIKDDLPQTSSSVIISDDKDNEFVQNLASCPISGIYETKSKYVKFDKIYNEHSFPHWKFNELSFENSNYMPKHTIEKNELDVFQNINEIVNEPKQVMESSIDNSGMVTYDDKAPYENMITTNNDISDTRKAEENETQNSTVHSDSEVKCNITEMNKVNLIQTCCTFTQGYCKDNEFGQNFTRSLDPSTFETKPNQVKFDHIYHEHKTVEEPTLVSEIIIQDSDVINHCEKVVDKNMIQKKVQNEILEANKEEEDEVGNFKFQSDWKSKFNINEIIKDVLTESNSTVSQGYSEDNEFSQHFISPLEPSTYETNQVKFDHIYHEHENKQEDIKEKTLDETTLVTEIIIQDSDVVNHCEKVFDKSMININNERMAHDGNEILDESKNEEDEVVNLTLQSDWKSKFNINEIIKDVLSESSSTVTEGYSEDNEFQNLTRPLDPSTFETNLNQVKFDHIYHEQENKQEDKEKPVDETALVTEIIIQDSDVVNHCEKVADISMININNEIMLQEGNEILDASKNEGDEVITLQSDSKAKSNINEIIKNDLTLTCLAVTQGFNEDTEFSQSVIKPLDPGIYETKLDHVKFDHIYQDHENKQEDIKEKPEDETTLVTEIIIQDSDVVNRCEKVSDKNINVINNEKKVEDGIEILEASNAEDAEVVNCKLQSDWKSTFKINEIIKDVLTESSSTLPQSYSEDNEFSQRCTIPLETKLNQVNFEHIYNEQDNKQEDIKEKPVDETTLVTEIIIQDSDVVNHCEKVSDKNINVINNEKKVEDGIEILEASNAEEAEVVNCKLQSDWKSKFNINEIIKDVLTESSSTLTQSYSEDNEFQNSTRPLDPSTFETKLNHVTFEHIYYEHANKQAIEDKTVDEPTQVTEIIIQDSDVINHCDKVSDKNIININNEIMAQDGNEILDVSKNEEDEVVNLTLQSDSQAKSNICEIIKDDLTETCSIVTQGYTNANEFQNLIRPLEPSSFKREPNQVNFEHIYHAHANKQEANENKTRDEPTLLTEIIIQDSGGVNHHGNVADKNINDNNEKKVEDGYEILDASKEEGDEVVNLNLQADCTTKFSIREIIKDDLSQTYSSVTQGYSKDNEFSQNVIKPLDPGIYETKLDHVKFDHIYQDHENKQKDIKEKTVDEPTQVTEIIIQDSDIANHCDKVADKNINDIENENKGEVENDIFGTTKNEKDEFANFKVSSDCATKFNLILSEIIEDDLTQTSTIDNEFRQHFTTPLEPSTLETKINHVNFEHIYHEHANKHEPIENQTIDEPTLVTEIIKDTDVVNYCDNEKMGEDRNDILGTSKREKDEVVNFKLQSDCTTKFNVGEIIKDDLMETSVITQGYSEDNEFSQNCTRPLERSTFETKLNHANFEHIYHERANKQEDIKEKKIDVPTLVTEIIIDSDVVNYCDKVADEKINDIEKKGKDGNEIFGTSKKEKDEIVNFKLHSDLTSKCKISGIIKDDLIQTSTVTIGYSEDNEFSQRCTIPLETNTFETKLNQVNFEHIYNEHENKQEDIKEKTLDETTLVTEIIIQDSDVVNHCEKVSDKNINVINNEKKVEDGIEILEASNAEDAEVVNCKLQSDWKSTFKINEIIKDVLTESSSTLPQSCSEDNEFQNSTRPLDPSTFETKLNHVTFEHIYYEHANKRAIEDKTVDEPTQVTEIIIQDSGGVNHCDKVADKNINYINNEKKVNDGNETLEASKEEEDEVVSDRKSKFNISEIIKDDSTRTCSTIVQGYSEDNEFQNLIRPVDPSTFETKHNHVKFEHIYHEHKTVDEPTRVTEIIIPTSDVVNYRDKVADKNINYINTEKNVQYGNEILDATKEKKNELPNFNLQLDSKAKIIKDDLFHTCSTINSDGNVDKAFFKNLATPHISSEHHQISNELIVGFDNSNHMPKPKHVQQNIDEIVNEPKRAIERSIDNSGMVTYVDNVTFENTINIDNEILETRKAEENKISELILHSDSEVKSNITEINKVNVIQTCSTVIQGFSEDNEFSQSVIKPLKPSTFERKLNKVNFEHIYQEHANKKPIKNQNIDVPTLVTEIIKESDVVNHCDKAADKNINDIDNEKKGKDGNDIFGTSKKEKDDDVNFKLQSDCTTKFNISEIIKDDLIQTCSTVTKGYSEDNKFQNFIRPLDPSTFETKLNHVKFEHIYHEHKTVEEPTMVSKIIIQHSDIVNYCDKVADKNINDINTEKKVNDGNETKEEKNEVLNVNLQLDSKAKIIKDDLFHTCSTINSGGNVDNAFIQNLATPQISSELLILQQKSNELIGDFDNSNPMPNLTDAHQNIDNIVNEPTPVMESSIDNSGMVTYDDKVPSENMININNEILDTRKAEETKTLNFIPHSDSEVKSNITEMNKVNVIQTCSTVIQGYSEDNMFSQNLTRPLDPSTFETKHNQVKFKHIYHEHANKQDNNDKTVNEPKLLMEIIIPDSDVVNHYDKVSDKRLININTEKMTQDRNSDYEWPERVINKNDHKLEASMDNKSSIANINTNEKQLNRMNDVIIVKSRFRDNGNQFKSTILLENVSRKKQKWFSNPLKIDKIPVQNTDSIPFANVSTYEQDTQPIGKLLNSGKSNISEINKEDCTYSKKIIVNGNSKSFTDDLTVEQKTQSIIALDNVNDTPKEDTINNERSKNKKDETIHQMFSKRLNRMVPTILNTEPDYQAAPSICNNVTVHPFSKLNITTIKKDREKPRNNNVKSDFNTTSKKGKKKCNKQPMKKQIKELQGGNENLRILSPTRSSERIRRQNLPQAMSINRDNQLLLNTVDLQKRLTRSNKCFANDQTVASTIRKSPQKVFVPEEVKAKPKKSKKIDKLSANTQLETADKEVEPTTLSSSDIVSHEQTNDIDTAKIGQNISQVKAKLSNVEESSEKESFSTANSNSVKTSMRLSDQSKHVIRRLKRLTIPLINVTTSNPIILKDRGKLRNNNAKPDFNTTIKKGKKKCKQPMKKKIEEQHRRKWNLRSLSPTRIIEVKIADKEVSPTTLPSSDIVCDEWSNDIITDKICENKPQVKGKMSNVNKNREDSSKNESISTANTSSIENSLLLSYKSKSVFQRLKRLTIPLVKATTSNPLTKKDVENSRNNVKPKFNTISKKGKKKRSKQLLKDQIEELQGGRRNLRILSRMRIAEPKPADKEIPPITDVSKEQSNDIAIPQVSQSLPQVMGKMSNVDDLMKESSEKELFLTANSNSNENSLLLNDESKSVLECNSQSFEVTTDLQRLENLTIPLIKATTFNPLTQKDRENPGNNNGKSDLSTTTKKGKRKSIKKPMKKQIIEMQGGEGRSLSILSTSRITETETADEKVAPSTLSSSDPVTVEGSNDIATPQVSPNLPQVIGKKSIVDENTEESSEKESFSNPKSSPIGTSLILQDESKSDLQKLKRLTIPLIKTTKSKPITQKDREQPGNDDFKSNFTRNSKKGKKKCNNKRPIKKQIEGQQGGMRNHGIVSPTTITKPESADTEVATITCSSSATIGDEQSLITLSSSNIVNNEESNETITPEVTENLPQLRQTISNVNEIIEEPSEKESFSTANSDSTGNSLLLNDESKSSLKWNSQGPEVSTDLQRSENVTIPLIKATTSNPVTEKNREKLRNNNMKSGLSTNTKKGKKKCNKQLMKKQIEELQGVKGNPRIASPTSITETETADKELATIALSSSDTICDEQSLTTYSSTDVVLNEKSKDIATVQVGETLPVVTGKISNVDDHNIVESCENKSFSTANSNSIDESKSVLECNSQRCEISTDLQRSENLTVPLIKAPISNPVTQKDGGKPRNSNVKSDLSTTTKKGKKKCTKQPMKKPIELQGVKGNPRVASLTSIIETETADKEVATITLSSSDTVCDERSLISSSDVCDDKSKDTVTLQVGKNLPQVTGKKSNVDHIVEGSSENKPFSTANSNSVVNSLLFNDESKSVLECNSQCCEVTTDLQRLENLTIPLIKENSSNPLTQKDHEMPRNNIVKSNLSTTKGKRKSIKKPLKKQINKEMQGGEGGSLKILSTSRFTETETADEKVAPSTLPSSDTVTVVGSNDIVIPNLPQVMSRMPNVDENMEESSEKKLLSTGKTSSVETALLLSDESKIVLQRVNKLTIPLIKATLPQKDQEIPRGNPTNGKSDLSTTTKKGKKKCNKQPMKKQIEEMQVGEGILSTTRITKRETTDTEVSHITLSSSDTITVEGSNEMVSPPQVSPNSPQAMDKMPNVDENVERSSEKELLSSTSTSSVETSLLLHDESKSVFQKLTIPLVKATTYNPKSQNDKEKPGKNNLKSKKTSNSKKVKKKYTKQPMKKEIEKSQGGKGNLMIFSPTTLTKPLTTDKDVAPTTLPSSDVVCDEQSNDIVTAQVSQNLPQAIGKISNVDDHKVESGENKSFSTANFDFLEHSPLLNDKSKSVLKCNSEGSEFANDLERLENVTNPLNEAITADQITQKDKEKPRSSNANSDLNTTSKTDQKKCDGPLKKQIEELQEEGNLMIPSPPRITESKTADKEDTPITLSSSDTVSDKQTNDIVTPQVSQNLPQLIDRISDVDENIKGPSEKESFSTANTNSGENLPLLNEESNSVLHKLKRVTIPLIKVTTSNPMTQKDVDQPRSSDVNSDFKTTSDNDQKKCDRQPLKKQIEELQEEGNLRNLSPPRITKIETADKKVAHITLPSSHIVSDEQTNDIVITPQDSQNLPQVIDRMSDVDEKDQSEKESFSIANSPMLNDEAKSIRKCSILDDQVTTDLQSLEILTIPLIKATTSNPTIHKDGDKPRNNDIKSDFNTISKKDQKKCNEQPLKKHIEELQEGNLRILSPPRITETETADKEFTLSSSLIVNNEQSNDIVTPQVSQNLPEVTGQKTNVDMNIEHPNEKESLSSANSNADELKKLAIPLTKETTSNPITQSINTSIETVTGGLEEKITYVAKENTRKRKLASDVNKPIKKHNKMNYLVKNKIESESIMNKDEQYIMKVCEQYERIRTDQASKRNLTCLRQTGRTFSLEDWLPNVLITITEKKLAEEMLNNQLRKVAEAICDATSVNGENSNTAVIGNLKLENKIKTKKKVCFSPEIGYYSTIDTDMSKARKISTLNNPSDLSKTDEDVIKNRPIICGDIAAIQSIPSLSKKLVNTEIRAKPFSIRLRRIDLNNIEQLFKDANIKNGNEIIKALKTNRIPVSSHSTTSAKVWELVKTTRPYNFLNKTAALSQDSLLTINRPNITGNKLFSQPETPSNIIVTHYKKKNIQKTDRFNQNTFSNIGSASCTDKIQPPAAPVNLLANIISNLAPSNVPNVKSSPTLNDAPKPAPNIVLDEVTPDANQKNPLIIGSPDYIKYLVECRKFSRSSLNREDLDHEDLSPPSEISNNALKKAKYYKGKQINPSHFIGFNLEEHECLLEGTSRDLCPLCCYEAAKDKQSLMKKFIKANNLMSSPSHNSTNEQDTNQTFTEETLTLRMTPRPRPRLRPPLLIKLSSPCQVDLISIPNINTPYFINKSCNQATFFFKHTGDHRPLSKLAISQFRRSKFRPELSYCSEPVQHIDLHCIHENEIQCDEGIFCEELVRIPKCRKRKIASSFYDERLAESSKRFRV